MRASARVATRNQAPSIRLLMLKPVTMKPSEP
jgi:hypothetical protein